MQIPVYFLRTAAAFPLCAATLLVIAQAGAVETCQRDQICGLKNAEDLVWVAGTQWAIASRLAKDPAAPGGFSLVDLDSHTAQVLQPDFSKPVAQRYAQCPRPPASVDLITHGLDLHRAPKRSRELFAVNHGGRQSIEIFGLEVKKEGVGLTWRGCVTLPSDMSANAVVGLADGVAVTSFGSDGDQGTADLLSGKPAGYVGRWTQKGGWVQVRLAHRAISCDASAKRPAASAP